MRKSWATGNLSRPRSESAIYCLRWSWESSFFFFSKVWCSTSPGTRTAPHERVALSSNRFIQPLDATPNHAVESQLFKIAHFDSAQGVLSLSIRSKRRKYGFWGDSDKHPSPFSPSDGIGDGAYRSRNLYFANRTAPAFALASDFCPTLRLLSRAGCCFRVHHKHKHLSAWTDPYRTGVLYL